MIDNVMVNIGAAFMIVGGAVLVSVILGLAIYAVALVWVSAINKLRRRAKLIMRCKDCKHRIYKNMGDEIGEIGGCGLFNCAMPNEGFCSHGERKDGGNG